MNFRDFFLVALALVLVSATYTISAQDNIDPQVVVEDYLTDFNEDVLAENAIVYDDAYGVTFDGRSAYVDSSMFYDDTFENADLTVNGISKVGADQVLADLTANLPDMDTPIEMEAVFHVNDESLIDDIDYYYDNNAFRDFYDMEPSTDYALGFNREMVERIEDNPTDYYGTSVTVEGVVEEMLDNRSFILQDMEPFDLTPAEFLVVGGTDDLLAESNADITQGQRVRVTGVLNPLEFDDLEEEIGWDADDSILGRFSDDSDEFTLTASHVRLLSNNDTLVMNPWGDEDDTETVNTSDVTSDFFGLDSETAELVEDNPDVFYGETVTVRGHIENIIGEGAGLRVQNYEPLDFTPPTFMVVDANQSVFMDMNLKEGEIVEVTGRLEPFERADFRGEYPGWDIDDSILADWVEDTDEFLLFADSLNVIEEE